ncbi:DUF4129 domain-containing protein [Arthrobacter sp. 08Y14]|uniref:DUF4129 domain-containing protein n=1 Tax=Arthrobacter sp. 08Y14 TaxID=2058885 RepID=UPI000CE3D4B0|nr:DUF4129 domain-containing protein [Arthrobacter sp. 08Y14]
MMLRAAGPLQGFGVRKVPVLPDADQGREWAEQELSRPVYQAAEPTLLERFWQWVGNFFTELLNGIAGFDPTIGVLLLAVGAAAVLAAAVFLVRPRLNARRRREVFDSGEVRIAVDHRRLAEEAAARAEWDTAVTERLRAIIRSAEERVVLEPRPGRTAAEAGHILAGSFPSALDEIMWLARRFDDVRYGHLPATSGDAQRAGVLDALLERLSPAVPSPARNTLAVPR